MSDKPVIFISYSSKDENLASGLKEQLDACFDSQINIFMARYSIEPSQDWLDEIVRNLDLAEAVVILMTPNSKNSYWVGFEIGYLYKKINGNISELPVYPLYLPDTDIFGPFWRTHGTSLGNANDLKSFFEKLCQQFQFGDIRKIDVDGIIQHINGAGIKLSDETIKAELDAYLSKEYEPNTWIRYSKLDQELGLPQQSAVRFVKEIAEKYSFEVVKETTEGVQFQRILGEIGVLRRENGKWVSKIIK